MPTPRFSLADFMPPADYQKSAREEKRRWHDHTVAKSLADYGNEAYEGRDEEERRGAAAEKVVRQASEAANKPTITEAEIARRFSRESDKASDSFLKETDDLRTYAGESGVTGGGEIAGIAAMSQLRRLAQLTTVKGDLMSFKATSDALDRQRQYDRQKDLAAYVNRPISMLGIDFQNQALQTKLAQLGVESNRQAAKYAAEASKP